MQPRDLRRSQMRAQPVEDVYGRRHRPDYGILILSIILLAIGIVVVYAISPALAATKNASPNFYVVRQLIAILLGIVAFIAISQIPLRVWRQLYKPLLIAAGLATLIALIMPVNADYPAHRWIRLGPLSLQSAELVKFGLLIWLATFLNNLAIEGKLGNLNASIKQLGITFVVIGGIVAGIQSDFGSAFVMTAMMAGMVFVAGVPVRRLLVFGAVIGLVGIGLIASTPYRQDRLKAFLQPEAHCSDVGYQQCQALIAVGSGGVAGQGLGRGVQAFGYLPEAENDSIFAVYAEKFGFLGAAILVGLFAALFTRMRSIADRAPDMFSRLIVVGVIIWFATQTMINIGAMIGLLPLKGITLPFISYGGTSVLFVMAALGLIFQISRHTSYRVSMHIKKDQGDKYDDRDDRRRVRRPYNANLGSRA